MLATSSFLEGEIEDETRVERVGDSPESRKPWYADLLGFGGRGVDAAEHVREMLIDF